MHMQGKPKTMQNQPEYRDIVTEIKHFFSARIAVCEQAGIDRNRLILDPGFGFGKTLLHNTELLGQLEKFIEFDLPLLVGISRKTMIGQLLQDTPVDQRLYGSLSAAVIAAMKGANIIRVHDVKASMDAIKIVSAIKNLQ
jgi:dihydropteroate synthase